MEEKIKELFSTPLEERMEYFMRNIGLRLRDDCNIECVDLEDGIVYIGSIKYGRFAFKLKDLTLIFAAGEMKNMESISKFLVEELLKQE